MGLLLLNWNTRLPPDKLMVVGFCFPKLYTTVRCALKCLLAIPYRKLGAIVILFRPELFASNLLVQTNAGYNTHPSAGLKLNSSNMDGILTEVFFLSD